MQKKFTKILSVLLVLIIAASVIPMSAFNASAATYGGNCGANLTWNYNTSSKTLTISGTGAMNNYLYSNCPWERYKDNIQEIDINDGVTTIGYDALSSCDNITSITIPDSVTTIEGFGFAYNKNLESVKIGSGVKTIGNYAFSFCSNLKSIEIPKNVTAIGDSVFYLCHKLENITVDNNNDYYSSNEDGILFDKNKTLLIQYPIGNSRKSYTVPDSVITIGQEAFMHCINLESITISCNVNSIQEDALTYCDNLKNITVDINNQYYSSDCGVLFNKDKTKLVQYPIGIDGTTYIIPDSVKTIGHQAFTNCQNITGIVIPDTVTKIETFAFSSCENLKNVTMGNGIKAIDRYVFYWCKNLKSIAIPKSVTTIDVGAFHLCEKLTDVYYEGTETDWNSIDINNYWEYNEYLLNANIHFNSCLHQFETQPTNNEQCYTTYTCSICGYSYVDATGHSDTDNDGNCDVCNEHLCDHACHKSGIAGFFWKITLFFSKLFGSNKFCECGAAHY